MMMVPISWSFRQLTPTIIEVKGESDEEESESIMIQSVVDMIDYAPIFDGIPCVFQGDYIPPPSNFKVIVSFSLYFQSEQDSSDFMKEIIEIL